MPLVKSTEKEIQEIVEGEYKSAPNFHYMIFLCLKILWILYCRSYPHGIKTPPGEWPK